MSFEKRTMVQMAGEFELAGWSFSQVLPVGDDWVESDCRIVAGSALGQTR